MPDRVRITRVAAYALWRRAELTAMPIVDLVEVGTQLAFERD